MTDASSNIMNINSTSFSLNDNGAHVVSQIRPNEILLQNNDNLYVTLSCNQDA